MLDDLKKQIRESGSSLTFCRDASQAKKLCKFLEEKLPDYLGVCILREKQVNVFRISESGNIQTTDSSDFIRDGSGGHDGSKSATKMPERVKKWREQTF
tara:strand:- start:735 stop:1031 length:297 start_codon:yes stop_codon:yes gene_type:complete